MGLCLRGKMVDAGILPQPAVAIAEPDAATAPQPAALTDPEVAIAEPQLDVTPPAPTAAPADTAAPVPDNLVAATFGLLRAEPDGSMVIAGSGTPGSEVEVYSNDQLLGKAKVEASGDWVLVPDAPIPPGGTELTLAEAGKEGRAAESFVVVINDDKSSEPLVVASTPGSASEVLQGLTPPPAGSSTDVAAVDPTPAPTPTPPGARDCASRAVRGGCAGSGRRKRRSLPPTETPAADVAAPVATPQPDAIVLLLRQRRTSLRLSRRP